ncbi:MAG: SCP2 sterol-binding domain-containing protein [Pseudomonadota bacterium]|nr:SCP2 sterol-binding domain-containing protein [Pseudomonadota bacterium]
MLNLRQRAEQFLGNAIRTNPDCERLCADLAGRLLVVQVSGLSRPINLMVMADGSVLLPAAQAPADVTIAGTLPALGAYLLGIEPRNVALRDDLHVSGNAHLAQKFQALFRGARLDWEESLAGAVGDLPARRLNNLAKGGAAAARQAGETLVTTLLDYVKYESERVPAPEEWHAFVADLAALRRDLDSAERRLRDLAARRP